MAKKITKKSLKRNIAPKKIAGSVIKVKNAEGDSDTKATVLIQNKINFLPKVSVIIPVYNVAEYLSECLESVINQTLKEIEIICIDDGSTDNSLNILKKYAEKDKRIMVIKQENLHAGVARNAGLAVARGKYLSFLDSDDFFDLNLLEENYKIAEKENADIVFYQYKNYNNETKEAEKTDGIYYPAIIDESGYCVLKSSDIIDKIFTICNPMPWNKLIKKDFIKDNEIRFQSLKASNDVYFSLVSLACSKKIVLFYKPFVYYRHNRKDSLKNNRDKNPLSFYEAYKAIYNTLKSKGIKDIYKVPFLKSLVSTCFWTIEHTDNMRSEVRNFIKETIVPEFEIIGENRNLLPEHLRNKLNQLDYPEFIVSLTSFPGRIETVNQTIESLLNQTMKADRVILWLAPEQFPKKEAELPKQLLALKSKGLTIDWYHDIRSYKKLIPTLRKYSDAIIVTADDDIIYKKTCLKKLFDTWLRNKNNIIAHRISRLFWLEDHLEIFPRKYYSKSDKSEYKDELRFGSIFNMQTGCGAVLYPPKCFFKDVLNEDLIKELAPTNDDQWFWAMSALAGYKVIVPEHNEFDVEYVPGSQDGDCLWKINDRGEKLYFKDLANILTHYKELVSQIKEASSLNNRLLNKISYKDRMLEAQKYKNNLTTWYRQVTGKYLDLEQPKTYNEKLQWLKLYNSIPLKTKLADKLLVRDWVQEKIGEQYLVPLLGVYDKFEDIDFSSLPDQFVIKCNHGSGWNIIVTDKSKLDLADVKAKLDKWMSENFAFKWGFELHYRDITPKIIIEKYIDPKISDHEIQVWTFNGEIKFVSVETIKDIEALERGVFYPDGSRTEFEISPQHYKRMEGGFSEKAFKKAVELAKSLLIDVPYVRIDFVEYGDDVVFRELTFTSGSGLSDIKPDKYNMILGNMIKLPKLAYNIDTGKYYKLEKKSKVKAYLLFPYYLYKLYSEKRKYFHLTMDKIVKQLRTFRLDIKNHGSADNELDIVADGTKIVKPAWYKNEQGQGSVVEGNSINQNLKVVIKGDGILRISFKAPDRRHEGKRFPVYVDYESIKIDGTEVLKEPVSAWHDVPFRYEMPVKNGQVVEIIISQKLYKYEISELKDIILKLNPKSDYIISNINLFIKELSESY